MLTAAQNELLTLTGSGTPMGEYFRRFWQPVALSEELAEPDGPPLRVTVLGEALVAFRDSEGRVGLIDRRCPHRGADLFYGRNEDCGLRCVYHGWKFDVDGMAVELPNVPPGVRMHDAVSIQAYPTREYGDIVWAYLGPGPDRLPANHLPEVPQFEFGLMPPEKRYVSKQLVECNWAQILEGGLDTSHFSFLHMPAPSVGSSLNPHSAVDERRMKWMRDDPMPRFTILEHEAGFVVGGVRRTDDAREYWRTTQFLLPSHGTGPSTVPGGTYFGYTVVPIDDVACWMYVYAWNPEQAFDEKELQQLKSGFGIIARVGPDYVPLSNRGNDYMIDRERQKHVNYTGIMGLAEQDLMIQQSQGPILDRTRENLTATDAAVVRFRRRLMEAAEQLATTGEEPAAPWHHEYYRTRPGASVADAETPMEEVMRQRFGDPLGRVPAT